MVIYHDSPAVTLRLFSFCPAAFGLTVVVDEDSALLAPPPPLGYRFRGDVKPDETFFLPMGGDSEDPFLGDPGAVGPPVLGYEFGCELLWNKYMLVLWNYSRNLNYCLTAVEGMLNPDGISPVLASESRILSRFFTSATYILTNSLWWKYSLPSLSSLHSISRKSDLRSLRVFSCMRRILIRNFVLN